MVSSAARGGDAIIISPDAEPVRVPLPALTDAAVRQHASRLLSARTPGHADLPATARDARIFDNGAAGVVSIAGETATADRVLAEMAEATRAHFSCHATASVIAPSRGGLVLHDALLPLARISGLPGTGGELAYLPACSSADPGIRNADETLTLMSAFQLAGFRHVIGSLWPMADAIAYRAAAAFYQGLPDTPAADGAATALHAVVLELRGRYPDRPDQWAALVHSGP